MKNRIRNILYISIVAIISILGITAVYAKTGESLTIDKKDFVIVVGEREDAKFHTTMGYAWCITPDKVGAPQGSTLTYLKNETDGSILYILDHAKTDDESYISSQLALWLYTDNYMPDAYIENSNSSVVKNAKAILAAAKNNKNYSTAPKIVLNASDTNMTLKTIDNDTYFVSNTLSASLTNATNYKVTLTNAPTGTKIVNSSNKETSSFKNGETFTIMVPEASVESAQKIKVKVSATGTNKYVEVYTPENKEKQDLALVRSEEKTVSSETELSVSPVKRVCEVYKGKYYGEDGKETTKENYTKQCTHECEVYKGKYFDSFGKETTLEEYTKQCTHKCEIINGKYYGKDGKETNKTTYENECKPTQIVVPSTGSSSLPLGIYLLIGILPIIGGTSIILKTNKEN